ncbi:MAG TPA: DUF4147 domain-containing protein, partial [Kofleriaceae bacterium]|nr:DUF4147 domain-containing protein [Kofleriaceae bacterium]
MSAGVAALAAEIFEAALAGLSPEERAADALARLDFGPGPVVVCALGKSAVPMAAGAVKALGGQISGGVVVAPAVREIDPRLQVVAGAHPVPDARSEAAARALFAAVSGSPRDGAVIALISGGGSALAALPALGLTLADKVAAISAVYAAGVAIGGLNAVRKHLSAVKGGRLGAAATAPVTTLISSDVVGDDPSTVASGPTVADATTFADARQVIDDQVGWARIPASVRAILDEGRDETPKVSRPGDRVEVIAGIGALADAAAAAATARGLSTRIRSRGHQSTVAELAEILATEARRLISGQCLVWAGETTLALVDHPGTGGRAHHLALSVAEKIRGVRGVCVLCAGSDGIDGNTRAAGAQVTGESWDAIARTGIDPAAALVAQDSATALAAIGAQI